MAPASTKPSLLSGNEIGQKPLSQKLLQDDSIRHSGVSGPLGMGVVMHSKPAVRFAW